MLAALSGVILVALVVVVAVVALFLGSIELNDNPCALGDEPCDATIGDRVIGITAVLGGIGTLGFALASAVYAFAFAAKPTERRRRLWGRCALIAVAILLVSCGVVLAVGDSSAHR